MSVRQWGEGSAAAFPIRSDDPALQYVAFTYLHADRPREQPGRETISCGANLFRLTQCALPHRRHSPSVFEEFCTNGAVPSDVRVELRLPELRPRRSASMPRPLVSTLPSWAPARRGSPHCGRCVSKRKILSSSTLRRMARPAPGSGTGVQRSFGPPTPSPHWSSIGYESLPNAWTKYRRPPQRVAHGRETGCRLLQTEYRYLLADPWRNRRVQAPR